MVETNKKMPILGFYGYWVILTYMSVVSSIVGIYFSFGGNVKAAMVCLIISGICDMFDGRVASFAKRSKLEKNFGIQIDSLADVISFGVFPTIMGYSIYIHHTALSGNTWCTIGTMAILTLYTLAALIRLAYYNVTEEELQNNQEKRKHYDGLPVTTAALIIPLIYSICIYFKLHLYGVYMATLTLMALAFVAKIKIPKFKIRTLIIIGAIALLLVGYVFLGGV